MAGKTKRISESVSGSDEEHDKEESLASDLVVTKYAQAADIVNAVLKEVVAAVKEDVEVGALCDLGDKLILERTSKVFKKEKEIQKGIAMPTCISVDNCICHFSPLRSDPPVVLRKGQMVKIDLGTHIDGFVATAAHTVVVGASASDKTTGPKANALMAAYNAMEAAIRMLRPGLHKNMEITDMIDRIAGFYKVKPVENMLSHQLVRNKIDGEKQIIQNPGDKQRSEMTKCTFDKYEAYAIDIIMSTGEGRVKPVDTRTTVYKRTDDLVYSLKMKASRTFFSTAVTKYGSMPFTLRAFEEEKAAKMGVVECERHGLLQPYQVLYEKEGESVAQFKSTVLILPGGLLKIAGLPLETSSLDCEEKITDSLVNALLNTSLKPKKAKKKTDEKKEGGAGDEKKEGGAEDEKKEDVAEVKKEGEPVKKAEEPKKEPKKKAAKSPAKDLKTPAKADKTADVKA